MYFLKMLNSRNEKNNILNSGLNRLCFAENTSKEQLFFVENRPIHIYNENISNRIEKNVNNNDCLSSTLKHTSRKNKEKIFIITKFKLINNWTKQEDILLLDKAKKFPKKNWKIISEFFPGKSAIQCSSRFRRIQPGLSKGNWTKDEDEKLLKSYRKNGMNWKLIANEIKIRNGKQIRDRFLNSLNPYLNKEKFSIKEDKKLIFFYKKYGPSWVKISRFFRGRSGDMLKNRFYSFIKNCKNEFKISLKLVKRKMLNEEKKTKIFSTNTDDIIKKSLSCLSNYSVKNEFCDEKLKFSKYEVLMNSNKILNEDYDFNVSFENKNNFNEMNVTFLHNKNLFLNENESNIQDNEDSYDENNNNIFYSKNFFENNNSAILEKKENSKKLINEELEENKFKYNKNMDYRFITNDINFKYSLKQLKNCLNFEEKSIFKDQSMINVMNEVNDYFNSFIFKSFISNKNVNFENIDFLFNLLNYDFLNIFEFFKSNNFIFQLINEMKYSEIQNSNYSEIIKSKLNNREIFIISYDIKNANNYLKNKLFKNYEHSQIESINDYIFSKFIKDIHSNINQETSLNLKLFEYYLNSKCDLVDNKIFLIDKLREIIELTNIGISQI